MERTLAIIKPDSVAKGYIGKIFTMLEPHRFGIRGMKMVHLTKEQARLFYKVHAGRPFFEDLVSYMTEGPIVALVLEGEKAIERYRELMGATDPREAAAGTIRSVYGVDRSANCVHGSDSSASAREEIAFFFREENGWLA